MLRGTGVAGTAAITGGSITGTNVPYVVGRNAVPLVGVSSGTMGNNGALSGITALPLAYPNAYCFFPANAIVSGSSAGWYFTQFSSTTAGTVFNNTYTSGMPTVPSSPTAFSTTGPGAFTGDTTTETALVIPIPAGALGANGILEFWLSFAATNSAGTKTLVPKYGSTTLGAITAITTQVNQDMLGFLANRGVATGQVARVWAPTQNSMATAGEVYPTENSGNALNFSVTMARNTATDNCVLEFARLNLAYSA
jgi:hypothetical protein